MEILIQNRQKKSEINLKRIKIRIERILEVLKCDDVEISFLFVDNQEIQKLNSQYRNIDKPTDVLSFPQGEEQVNQEHRRILGDVVISPEMAQAHARDFGHSFEKEIDILITHGILHLLGYDHEGSKEGEELMVKMENVVKEHLGGLDKKI